MTSEAIKKITQKCKFLIRISQNPQYINNERTKSFLCYGLGEKHPYIDCEGGGGNVMVCKKTNVTRGVAAE